MTIIDIITQILETLTDIFMTPIDNVMRSIGSGQRLLDYRLKIGFGSVEWINIQLDDLVVIVLGVILGFIILRLIYRFIKWLFRLGKGLTGIR